MMHYQKELRESLGVQPRNYSKDFPGGPVAKTPRFQMQGAQVWSLVGELDFARHSEDQRSRVLQLRPNTAK